MLDLRLIQLKGGKAGVSGAEIARLKKAAAVVTVKWLIAAFDGTPYISCQTSPRYENTARHLAGIDWCWPSRFGIINRIETREP